MVERQKVFELASPTSPRPKVKYPISVPFVHNSGMSVFLRKQDMKHIKEPPTNLSIVISLNDLGDRGNFLLFSNLTRKVYVFKKGKYYKTLKR